MPRSRWHGLSILAAATLGLGLAACSKGPTSGAPRWGSASYLGLAANPTDDAPADSFGTALLTARATGVELGIAAPRWNELESAPGVIDLSSYRTLLAAYQSLGFVTYLNLRTVDTNQRAVPADLAAVSFASPAMIARMDAVVDSVIVLATQYPLVAIALGNEVDAYFSIHPAELADFVALYQREVGRIHARLPSLKVGIATISPVQNPNAAIGDQLNASSDVLIYTYYPFQPATDFLFRLPSTLTPDFAAMHAHAAGRPWALQEVGYGNSPVNGSSDSLQADFVRRFRAEVGSSSRSDLLFASWFDYTDWQSARVNGFLAYYGVSTPGFAAYLGHLGLRDSSGTPKPAWNAWRGF